MEFSLVGALVAGLIGTAVMSAMMKLSAKAGMTDMPPMELVTGSMMSADPDRAKKLGIMVHWIVMGAIVFGLGYAALFTAFGSASWLIGIGIGLVHGLVVGVVFMPMMPAVHPRMSDEPTFGGTVDVSAGSVRLAAPGVLGSKWGGMTPVGLVMGHAVYGLVVALVYRAFV
jgi:uncharacterized membrane protein YagU involved in acid resistance